MKRFALVCLLFLLLMGCGGGEISLSTANITSARLAKDEGGTQATTTFSPGDIFYLIVELANAPDDTRVKAAWTAVDVAGADPNSLLDDVELTSGDGTLTFNLTNDNPWPAGSYKVDIYINDQLDRSLDFRVSGGLGQQAEPTQAAEPAGSVAVDSLEKVKTAAIQIQAEGTFTDPEVGTLYNVAGRGSGFIIDPSGIAVTNNHVVTGAALLKVWVGGEREPRNAKILGVSECADLAVIDIEGDGYPYLEWYSDPIGVGLDVYAAGFPLGDPEYTLTRGIVSKARTNGDTNWASVKAVIEHDASINPGNSGGPLVSAGGKVVAVNYAGASQVNQYFAIAQREALDVIDRLKAGEDYLSIGINGSAVNDGQGLSGIWVSSVKSGSPADKAGVEAGDIITTLEGLVLATDGTMADYCDILRTHNSDDVLTIEVLRFATQEVLKGQLNGRELELSFSFAQTLSQEVQNNGSGGGSTAYVDYIQVRDNSGRLVMEVPAEWSDIDGSPWFLDNEEIGLSITASPSIDDFNTSWLTPGVFFAATDQFDLTVDETLDAFDYSGDCTFDARYDYDDSFYVGKYDLWTDCAGEGVLWVILATKPVGGGDTLILVQIQVVSDADLDALDRILATFDLQ